MRGLGFLIFVALTVVCWGLYGPVLHEGQTLLGAEGKRSLLRSYICVGIAYFLIAVLVPSIILFTKGEKGNWTLGGFIWSFAAGGIGALGALGIILAFKFRGEPTYVMPLVFGFAPVVNTFCTMFFSRTVKEASALFYTGVLIVAIGAAGVLILKPKAPAKEAVAAKTPVVVETTEPAAQAKDEGAKSGASETAPPAVEPAADAKAEQEKKNPPAAVPAEKPADKPADGKSSFRKLEDKAINWLEIAASIALTALCWGAYGPVLHKGQMKMGQSRLRPFLCVGLAYFVIAVVAAYFMLQKFPEPGTWNNWRGVFWSLLGGAAGAFGALGIIYAFNFGGKPIFVMPLVFGLAPVVNTFAEITTKGLQDRVSGFFYLSLLVTILGAVMVLVCAPKSHAPPAAIPPSQEAKT